MISEPGAALQLDCLSLSECYLTVFWNLYVPSVVNLPTVSHEPNIVPNIWHIALLTSHSRDGREQRLNEADVLHLGSGGIIVVPISKGRLRD